MDRLKVGDLVKILDWPINARVTGTQGTPGTCALVTEIRPRGAQLWVRIHSGEIFEDNRVEKVYIPLSANEDLNEFGRGLADI